MEWNGPDYRQSKRQRQSWRSTAGARAGGPQAPCPVAASCTGGDPCGRAHHRDENALFPVETRGIRLRGLPHDICLSAPKESSETAPPKSITKGLELR